MKKLMSSVIALAMTALCVPAFASTMGVDMKSGMQPQAQTASKMTAMATIPGSVQVAAIKIDSKLGQQVQVPTVVARQGDLGIGGVYTVSISARDTSLVGITVVRTPLALSPQPQLEPFAIAMMLPAGEFVASSSVAIGHSMASGLG